MLLRSALQYLLAWCISTTLAAPVDPPQFLMLSHARVPERTKVLILGGGMAGITAARTLHDQGISDFLVVEARLELGGRLISHTFGEPGRQHTIELGANWVQGTSTGDGPENPVWTLAKKHNLDTRFSSYFDGLCKYLWHLVCGLRADKRLPATFDEQGPADYSDVVLAASRNFDRLIASAGARLPKGLVDASARTGYSLTGSQPTTPHEVAAEYFHVSFDLSITSLNHLHISYLQFDWEFQSSPQETSWLASSWVNHPIMSRALGQDNSSWP